MTGLDNKIVTPTVGMLVFKNNFTEVLLVSHKKEAKHQTGTYGIPAGRIDVGETEMEAVLREFNQETGLTTEEKDIILLPFKYQAIIKRKGEFPRTFSLKVWYCKKYQGYIKEMEENVPEWLKVNELKSYNLLPNMEKVIKDAVSFLNK